MSTRIKAVFFDAGGTLVHPAPSLPGIYAAVTRDMGIEIDVEVFGRVLSTFWQDYQSNRGPETGFLPDSDEKDRHFWSVHTRRIYEAIPALAALDFDEWFDHLHDAFASSRSWRVYPEVDEVLGGLAERGLVLGIISNWSSSLMRICTELGLDGQLDFVLASAVVGCKKPSPEIFHKALEIAGVDSQEALHVGDTHIDDVVGAERAGIKPIYIDRGGLSLSPEAGGKDLRVLFDEVG